MTTETSSAPTNHTAVAEKYQKQTEHSGPHSKLGKFYRRESASHQQEAEKLQLMKEFSEALGQYESMVEAFSQKFLALAQNSEYKYPRSSTEQEAEIQSIATAFSEIVTQAKTLLERNYEGAKQTVNDRIFQAYDRILELAKTTSFITPNHRGNDSQYPLLTPFYRLAHDLVDIGLKAQIPGFEEREKNFFRFQIDAHLKLAPVETPATDENDPKNEVDEVEKARREDAIENYVLNLEMAESIAYGRLLASRGEDELAKEQLIRVDRALIEASEKRWEEANFDPDEDPSQDIIRTARFCKRNTGVNIIKPPLQRALETVQFNYGQLPPEEKNRFLIPA